NPDQRLQGAERVSGSSGIGGVSFYEDDRAVAPDQLPGELHRDGNQELHLSACQKVFPFRLALDLFHEIEIAACLYRLQKCPPLGAVVGNQYRSGKMLGVGVDGKTEKYQLQKRNSDHHPEGETIAAHLDELLHDDCPESCG